MAEVKILIKGYTSADSAEEGKEKTCATITLVKDKDIVMVVDPGILESQQMLIDALEKEGLTIDDVNIVCLTHSHIDHYRNVGMFPEAKTLEFYGLWDKNTVDEWEEQFTDDIKIIKTPGHDKTAITLLVKTDKGIVAICGDVFWKENMPEEDEYADEPKKLNESRKKIIELADHIVPGHADMYEVKK
jgi:glyoxylase-like metal-dependent hydrolase (beta-lactamase superfamily II)